MGVNFCKENVQMGFCDALPLQTVGIPKVYIFLYLKCTLSVLKGIP